ncbi:glycosyltransferase family 39 protein [Magnetovibrio sp. PR-2]|uniref:ArnT family glycosyltransferase n=1 Tax=Magnetovibrio sp. PR-2 TaxID=3120356 RepID=UPI002FCE4D20
MTKALSLLQKPLAVHGLVFAIVCAYALIRLTLMSALGGDEAEQVLFAQALTWGYDVTNPPLYTWMLSGIFVVLGKSAAVLMAVKLTVVGLLYITLYHAARMCLGPGRELDWALVGLSPVLLFVVAWHAIFSYSHSLLNGVFVVVTFMVLLKIATQAQWRWYALLGLVAGLGVLTKYSYVMFLIAVLVAGVTLPAIRARLFNAKIFLSLIIALTIITPHGLWLLDASKQMEDAVVYKLQMDQDLSYVQGVAKGLWNLIRASFAFLSPLWLVLLLVFPAFVKRPADCDALPFSFVEQLLRRTFLIVVALMILMVLGGATQFRPNYLFLLILLPLWVFVRLPVEANPNTRRKVYAGIVMAGCAASVLGLAVKAVTDPMNCTKCQHLMDYATIAEELRARGFEGGSILAHWYPNPLPGNLGLEFEEARIVSTKFPTLTPPLAKNADGQCLLIAISANQGGSDMANLSARAKEAFNLDIARDYPLQSFTVPYERMSGHSVQIDYVLLNANEHDLADCR